MKARGKHIAADFVGVEHVDQISDVDSLAALLVDACKGSGATVLDVLTRQFEPQGATVLVLLAESHASAHAFPERAALMVDVFTCGDCNPTATLSRLLEAIPSDAVRVRRLSRNAEPIEDPE